MPAPAPWSSVTAESSRQANKRLRALPGIGAYTAAAIAAIAFDAPASPVDGNIERVIARLFAVAAPLPAAKPQIGRRARELVPPRRAGDFAQAMMDLGATICTPKKPACALCPWNDCCAARARGDAETYPRADAQARRRVAPRRRLRRLPRRRLCARAHAPAGGSPRRHDRSPDDRLGAGFRRSTRARRRAAFAGGKIAAAARVAADWPVPYATYSRIFRWSFRSMSPSFRPARPRQRACAGRRLPTSAARRCRASCARSWSMHWAGSLLQSKATLSRVVPPVEAEAQC